MIHEDNLLTIILKVSLVLLLLSSVAGYLMISAPVGIGIFAGGSIAILNFIWQRRTLTRLLGHQISPTPGSAVFRYLFRLSLTGFMLYLMLTSGTVSVFGLLAGLSVIVAVIVLITLYSAFHKGD